MAHFLYKGGRKQRFGFNRLITVIKKKQNVDCSIITDLKPALGFTIYICKK